MRRRLAATGAEAAASLLESNDWKHLLILEGQDGVTIIPEMLTQSMSNVCLKRFVK